SPTDRAAMAERDVPRAPRCAPRFRRAAGRAFPAMAPAALSGCGSFSKTFSWCVSWLTPVAKKSGSLEGSRHGRENEDDNRATDRLWAEAIEQRSPNKRARNSSLRRRRPPNSIVDLAMPVFGRGDSLRRSSSSDIPWYLRRFGRGSDRRQND